MSDAAKWDTAMKLRSQALIEAKREQLNESQRILAEAMEGLDAADDADEDDAADEDDEVFVARRARRGWWRRLKRKLSGAT